MSEQPNPKIVATRGELRLIHQQRDEKHWPNISDLTLERLAVDAMGEAHWIYVSSWRLPEQGMGDVVRDPSSYAAYVALKMLLDTGPVTKK